ncbi:META domain-containing protein [Pseudonocardia acaciae]|uniref:META domain-containing protein n=1 Tax=Pseudonocardia acaciae TaxID=551276 RepID=UPI0006879A09|nr:META domain-containing protein [Pseudonocardia acaciae]
MARVILVLAVLLAWSATSGCGSASAEPGSGGSAEPGTEGSGGSAGTVVPAGLGGSAEPGTGGSVGYGDRPADRVGLVRRWVPVSGGGAANRRPPFVELRADGGWSGSDGCNGLRGTWSLGADGAWRATQGPTTKMACDNVNVGLWLERATSVRLDGAVLVLVDGGGQETGRLRAG